ncbi:MAG TPA: hypothetical protein DCW72_08160 [Elusimicrobia bacterium]|nr:MAG: hypothetical protein A2X29_07360 [Elusimicrobia bacterium GWA2_64_40]OGR64786.1 MAG: hypothetical protein A2X30_00670 [Elusimicrobia bacterium GWB2_63_16]HAN05985.1 hypothetical protein [Elusimicrobiota bacterium]HAU90179.1 hypothetical protein [Elusimicrobiota bacterium]
MHLLPGVLALLLLAAAPAGAATLADFAGAWTGAVQTTPKACSWKVNSRIKERNNLMMGSFNFKGPCGSGTGSFTAGPAGEYNCYTVNAGVPGLPRLTFLACFVSETEVRLKSVFLNGSVKISEDKRTAVFDASALVGTSRGKFRRVSPQPAKSGAKKGAKGGSDAEKELKPPTLEIHGGGR